jgi:hypothetical protein
MPFMEVHDGTRLYYADWGSGSGHGRRSSGRPRLSSLDIVLRAINIGLLGKRYRLNIKVSAEVRT